MATSKGKLMGKQTESDTHEPTMEITQVDNKQAQALWLSSGVGPRSDPDTELLQKTLILLQVMRVESDLQELNPALVDQKNS